MAEKKTAVVTFHQVRAQCEQASGDAWRAFLTFYSPMCLHLAGIYGCGDASAWEQTLERLAQNGFERFRAMPRQSEREFLLDLRAELFESMNPKGPAADGEPALDLERVAKIVDGLPLLHQEILWFKLAGYTDATLERVLRLSPAVARGALARLQPDFAAAIDLSKDGCLWPRSWTALVRQVRAAKKEECPPMHQLIRIQDGQVSWYDKEPVEKKVAGCLHCLESWTALREMGYWRQAAPTVSPALLEQFLGRIPIAKPKKSLLRRVLGS